MELKEVAAVSGKSGLYKVLKPTRSGVILETLDDQKKKLIASADSRVSVLKEISIYTTGAESSVMLEDVFKIIQEKYGKELPVSTKDSPEKLEGFMEEIIPDFDRERVYNSDMKKLVSWYTIIAEHAAELFDATSEEDASDEKKKEAKA